MQSSFAGIGNPNHARRKRVHYEGSNTIYEGMALCYNYDTTTNIAGYDPQNNAQNDYTTAEGYQNEGKYVLVEDPATANFGWLAGWVCAGAWVGKTGPLDVEIYIPNGAIIPVRTNANCAAGTVLGISDGSNIMQAVTGDGDPLGCAVAEETVDRSETTGLVLAKVFDTNMPISASNAFFTPIRYGTTGYAYGINIDATAIFRGGAAAKSYGVQITGDRESGYVASGDSNDAYLKISGSNYAACDTNFYLRGINVAISNRSGGTLGYLTNNIGVSGKQGGTVGTIIALMVDAQDLAATAKDYFGGLDVALNREGLAGTEEFGIRVRTLGTINSEINTVFRVDKDATDHGFTNLFNIEADAVNYAACTGDVTVDANDKVIPIVLGGTTYYLIAVDSIPAG